MPTVRLTERLTNASSPGRVAGRASDGLVVRSILDHLTRLLNTRKGSVPIDPHYGIDDLSNIAGSYAFGTTESICAEVAQQIQRYEPRLSQIRIHAGKGDDEREVITLRFDLLAKLTDKPGRAGDESVAMVMRINAGGRISLEERRDL